MCKNCDALIELVEDQIKYLAKSSAPHSGFCEGVIQSVLHIGGISQGEALELTRRAHLAEEARRNELKQLSARES